MHLINISSIQFVLMVKFGTLNSTLWIIFQSYVKIQFRALDSVLRLRPSLITRKIVVNFCLVGIKKRWLTKKKKKRWLTKNSLHLIALLDCLWDPSSRVICITLLAAQTWCSKNKKFQIILVNFVSPFHGVVPLPGRGTRSLRKGLKG